VAEITAQLVKQLRDSTGAGMMECKKALQEAEGSLDKAVDILRTRGLAAAAKKAARSTKQGIIGHTLTAGGKLAVLAEVNCESDFVARTEDFQQLVASVVSQVAGAAPANVAALLEQPCAADPTRTVAQFMAAKIAKVGENMNVPRFARHAAKGYVGAYTHPGAQLITMVDVVTGKPETASNPVFTELLHDLAMQVAAADPRFVSRDEVTVETLEREKDIQRSRALAEGKPEKIVDKVVEGRMSKYYEEVCLLEQPYIKDNAVSITQLLADKGKQLGDTLQVVAFLRFKVGETAQTEESAE
jgi:elongation factor Ts